MYNQQKLINLQEQINQSINKLLNNSEKVYSESIQETITNHLKSLIGTIDAMNATIETIFLMNHWGKSVHELYSEYPEEENSANLDLTN